MFVQVLELPTTAFDAYKPPAIGLYEHIISLTLGPGYRGDLAGKNVK